MWAYAMVEDATSWARRVPATGPVRLRRPAGGAPRAGGSSRALRLQRCGGAPGCAGACCCGSGPRARAGLTWMTMAAGWPWRGS